MKQLTRPHFRATVFCAALLCGIIGAQAQTAPQPDAPQVSKVEIGAQYTQLDFIDYSERVHAVGGRVTYNFTEHFAVEAEANFFPFQQPFGGYTTGGRPVQAQFGVKAGKRFRSISLFAKARPGLVTFGQTSRPVRGPDFIGVAGVFPTVDFVTERKTHFTLDVGGVLEINAARRVFVRLDAGDTIIRYGRHDELSFADFNNHPIVKAPAQTQHKLQFGAGVGFRLGALAADDAAVATAHAPSAPTRFEAGAQFTSLGLKPIALLFRGIIATSPPMTQTVPGFGGRFTYNLTSSLAVEAETNLLPRQTFLAVGASGRITQGQFGLKAGHRFARLGLFGKVRPGFVSFGSSYKQVGTRPVSFGDIHALEGIFVVGRRTFFAADVGGVFEFYATRRWLLRFDGGDTIIHYGERSIDNLSSLRQPITVAAPETRHNFQFSTGVGFRF